MSCGREPGGMHAERSGVCAASTDQRLDKVHGGMNAGKACWVVAGTLGRGRSDCTFARDFKQCPNCTFYKVVKSEEGIHFWPPELLRRLLGERMG